MSFRKIKNLISVVITLLLIVSVVTIVNYNKPKDTDNLTVEEEPEDIVGDSNKTNLLIKDNNSDVVKSTDELEQDRSIRILPDNTQGGIIVLPNPSLKEEVILNKL